MRAPPAAGSRTTVDAAAAVAAAAMNAILRAACPHCQAVFQLTGAQLHAREGLVRCGACRQIFNAQWHLASDVDRAPVPRPSSPAANFPPAPAAAPAARRRRPRTVEHYLRPRAHPLAGALWALAALALAALLAAQVKFLLVEKYASHGLLRPYLAAFCEVAACRLPPRHDPRRFAITRTHIDLHPRQPGALRVTVKLVNEATFAQPYPRLRLTLTDRDGWVVGRRAYAPADYLHGRANQLRSGELGAVFLDLARPHEKAVGFEVDVF